MKKIMAAIIVLTLCLSFNHNVFAEEETLTIEVVHDSAPIPFKDIYVTSNNFKSYMSYKAISDIDSPQYLLQELCSTDADGFRKCADRYVVAVGRGVGGQIGDCIDLFLSNGQVIYCVIGDYKDNKHTDAANFTGRNGCCSEFIVDANLLRKDLKSNGDIGCGYHGWDSPVLFIRRYNRNYLTDNGGSEA